MIKVITTVGTSLFDNFLKTSDSIEKKYNDLKDKPESEYQNNSEDISDIKKQVNNFAATNKNASAEIKSLIKIQEALKDDIEVYFICSDTILSKLAAEVIKENLTKENITFAQLAVISKLNVKNKKEFEREGLVNLVSEIYKIYDGYTEGFILNITGGFKGVIPYLTLLAQINSIPIKYIFEESDSLISIPQAPINVDFTIFEKHSNLIEKLETGLEVSKETFIKENKLYNSNLPDLIYEINLDGTYLISLNPLGKILWERYKNFDIVKIPKGSKYFEEDENKKRNLNTAIRKLLNQLDKAENFQTLNDVNLKHASAPDNSWIYKYASGNTQIRIQYKLENNSLTIFNYYFIQKQNDDLNYSKWISEEYQSLKNLDLTILTFPKENN